MYYISYKYKQFWFFIIKLSIVVGAGYFVYQKTFLNNQLPLRTLLLQVNSSLFQEWWVLPLLLGMTALNWILEIFKWRELVGFVKPITFKKASVQSLSSHTLSIVTPFKAGEYGGKALYFTKKERKKILGLNLVGNMTQLLVTFIFGMVGVVFFLTRFDVPIHPHKLRRLGYIIAFILASLFAGNKALTQKGKLGFYQKSLTYYKKIGGELRIKIFFLSVLRYLVFSHQFFLLLMFFGVEISYKIAILLIFSMYFIAALVPILSIFDFIIKGSIAIYLFIFVSIDETVIMSISTLMWLFNFVLPAILGSYFVLIFKKTTIKN